jgi:DNA-directed RNA polymerase subunit M/transcription elongation factor TFIIS
MDDAVMLPVGSETAAPRRPELRFCRECNDLMKPKVSGGHTLKCASWCVGCAMSVAPMYALTAPTAPNDHTSARSICLEPSSITFATLRPCSWAKGTVLSCTLQEDREHQKLVVSCRCGYQEDVDPSRWCVYRNEVHHTSKERTVILRVRQLAT